ncbi:GNAT family N-acetyltransferase [Sphingomonas turrisvirgatae]|uniref:GNAT family N-acetyltransferase n=1 Tax=Sphingomonas turrisvirgatae TaxID=1888892 RepID=A0A1E3LR31_9SPHN|nr:GNAT family N-acetyltransferase [Sphingomonas turrisvirgatae]ODP36231.1 GNAT family N-acetyltransferase [Sphingomonas turrisvirgatae]
MIETARLILRPWEDRDRAPFHDMCRDPQVMATLGPLMTREQSDLLVDRVIGFQRELGYTFWALQRREDGAFLGFCGLKPGALDTPIEGQVEIGWRLGSAHWGKGYAREAAQASLDWAWDHLNVAAVMAITARVNSRSWGLMERLGMQRLAELDFDHPQVPPDSHLRPHIVYRADRPA